MGVNVSLLFVGYPTQGSYSYDSRWQFQANSPAKAYGINGEDCGIFGGDSPYKLSGIADRPLIYSLDVPFSVGGNNVNINIKIRAEN